MKLNKILVALLVTSCLMVAMSAEAAITSTTTTVTTSSTARNIAPVKPFWSSAKPHRHLAAKNLTPGGPSHHRLVANTFLTRP